MRNHLQSLPSIIFESLVKALSNWKWTQSKTRKNIIYTVDNPVVSLTQSGTYAIDYSNIQLVDQNTRVVRNPTQYKARRNAAKIPLLMSGIQAFIGRPTEPRRDCTIPLDWQPTHASPVSTSLLTLTTQPPVTLASTIEC